MEHILLQYLVYKMVKKLIANCPNKQNIEFKNHRSIKRRTFKFEANFFNEQYIFDALRWDHWNFLMLIFAKYEQCIGVEFCENFHFENFMASLTFFVSSKMPQKYVKLLKFINFEWYTTILILKNSSNSNSQRWNTFFCNI